MNMEAPGGRKSSEKRELAEAEPSLPTDPTEAAAWLEEIWKGSGGWESQHPLRLKAKDQDYQTMSEEEKEQFNKLGNQFRWIAQMYDSELMWLQSYAHTNYGEVIGFRFGYNMPKNPEDNIPEAYVYKPFDEKQPKVFLSRGSDGWKVEPLEEVASNYIKHFP
jgi:hypothetical protein